MKNTILDDFKVPQKFRKPPNPVKVIGFLHDIFARLACLSPVRVWPTAPVSSKITIWPAEKWGVQMILVWVYYDSTLKKYEIVGISHEFTMHGHSDLVGLDVLDVDFSNGMGKSQRGNHLGQFLGISSNEQVNRKIIKPKRWIYDPVGNRESWF